MEYLVHGHKEASITNLYNYDRVDTGGVGRIT